MTFGVFNGLVHNDIPSHGYHASAVHFDGSTFLFNASPTISASGLLTASCFLRVPDITGQTHPWYFMFDINPAGDELGFYMATNTGGFIFSYFEAGGNHFICGAEQFPVDNNWHSVLMSIDVNHDAGSRLIAGYVDDVPLGFLPPNQDDGVAFQIDYSSGIGVPDTTDDVPAPLLIGDLALVQVYPGVSIVQNDNTINAPDRRKFSTAGNKPVDPAIPIAAYGNPAILFNGNATSFATNQGTGGDFTLTGTLTNASTSPSD